MSDPTQGEYRELIDVMKELMPLLSKVVAEPAPAQVGGVHQIVMQSPDSGERAMHRVEKMAILLGGMLVAAIGLIWSQNSRMDDMKADISSERASREAFDNWSNQEHTTVRGYIWTGKIEPMRPKPTASEARK